MVRAMIGGLQKVIHKRLYSDEADQLPRLATHDRRTGGSPTPPPPGPLEAARRRGRKARPFDERQAVAHPPERVLRALAAIVSEKGYQETTVAEVVERAAHLAAHLLRALREQRRGVRSPRSTAARRRCWGPSCRPSAARPTGRSAVHGAYEAMFAFGIEEPEYTPARRGRDVRGRQTRAADPRPVMEGLEVLLAPGYELAPDTPPIAAEAIGGAIYALIHDQVKRHGPGDASRSWSPMATYMTLAPFIGAEEAFALASGAAENGSKRPA